jgi:hypothetical protein
MKYTKYTSILGLFILLSSFSACESLLEEQPVTQISTEFFYQNEDDALAALTAAYAQLKNGVGYYRQQWLSNLIAASDQGTSSWKHGEFRDGNITETNQNLPNTWSQMYIAIRDANNVIARVPGIEEMDEELRNRVLGEARFLRGLHYFNLVRAFGEVPLRTMPVEPGDQEGLPVSPIEEIYAVIIDDLEYAATHCWGKEEIRNEYTNQLGRATKASAHALAAKVFLHIASAKRTAMEGIEGNQRYLGLPEDVSVYYQAAKDHADQALAQDGYALTTNLDDWVKIFDANNGNNPEMLFDIQGSSITEQGTAVSNLFSPRAAGLSGGGWGGTNKMLAGFINNHIDKTDPRFVNSIVTEYQDPTKTYVLRENMTGYVRTITATGAANGNLNQVFTAKYIDRDATTEYTSQQNWHVVRLADVYLMRAEALAELSQNPGAANADINTLRMRVGMDDFDGAAMSMEEFRTAILRERAAELYMEGHRFFDLTRMGVYDAYCKITFNPTRGQRGPEDYTWPIPLLESSANVNIGG